MLSDLLRNTLIDEIDTKVPLKDEISYLTNFIELQKLRIEYPEVIEFLSRYDSNDYSIYPLLLIPFVENAFKHGNINTSKHKVNINIIAENGILRFEITNSFKEKVKDSASGIGVNNVKKRLEHYYKDNYSLDIKNENGIFSVFLKIKL